MVHRIGDFPTSTKTFCYEIWRCGLDRLFTGRPDALQRVLLSARSGDPMADRLCPGACTKGRGYSIRFDGVQVELRPL